MTDVLLSIEDDELVTVAGGSASDRTYAMQGLQSALGDLARSQQSKPSDQLAQMLPIMMMMRMRG